MEKEGNFLRKMLLKKKSFNPVINILASGSYSNDFIPCVSKDSNREITVERIALSSVCIILMLTSN